MKKSLLVLPLMGSPAVFAAVPASVTTGIADATTDVGTVGALALGVIIVIVAFNWLRRVMK